MSMKIKSKLRAPNSASAAGRASRISRHRQAGVAGAAAGLYFAHSDLSGLSLFEEAQYRGITAARQAMERACS